MLEFNEIALPNKERLHIGALWRSEGEVDLTGMYDD
jgi:hypothetical protein